MKTEERKLLSRVLNNTETKNAGNKNKYASFLLVLNSFIDQAKASKYYYRMEMQGAKILIVKDSINIRVGIPFDSYNNAKETLEQYKEKYSGSWIMPIK